MGERYSRGKPPENDPKRHGDVKLRPSADPRYSSTKDRPLTAMPDSSAWRQCAYPSCMRTSFGEFCPRHREDRNAG
jgi:hypothetical protein